MALSVTVNLDDDREKTLNRLTNRWNKFMPTDPHTPSQHARIMLRDDLDAAAATFAQEDRVGLREAYNLATPAEQATINGLLDKYRT